MSKTSGSRRYVGFNERYKGKPSKPGNKQDAYGAAPLTQAVATGPPYVLVNDPDFTLYVGDVLEQLRDLPDESVHCVVTSPPYWGLRDYGTGSWAGGDPDCDHVNDLATDESRRTRSRSFGTARGRSDEYLERTIGYRDVCGKCGATRVDQQLGLEATPDLFVAAMVDVFREIRRVLRRDGTCWVNLGDSYNNRVGTKLSSHQRGLGFDSDDLQKSWVDLKAEGRTRMSIEDGMLKEKDLCGIPWRVAFALQADGWYLRSDIVWAKPNPMPESVTDRPTKAHEYVFLLTKGPRYFFDQEAVREPHKPESIERQRSSLNAASPRDGMVASHILNREGAYEPNMAGRNVRSVWEIATQPYPEAHFATFPEALPERCIRAGTSERGCCPECGAPWERETDTQYTKHRPSGSAEPRDYRAPDGNWNSFGDNLRKHVTTTGWRATCPCGDADVSADGAFISPLAPVPCTVLDPFMGSGTTALVARRLGRRSIGIELNPSYAALCARRLQQLSLFAGDAS